MNIKAQNIPTYLFVNSDSYLAMKAFLMVIMLNIVMYSANILSGTDRAFFNLDYFIPVLLLSLGFRWLYIGAFLSLAVIDFLVLFGQVFPAIRLNNLVYLLKFSWISSSSYQIYGTLLIILVILQLFVTLKLYRPKLNIYLLMIFNIFIVIQAIKYHLPDAQIFQNTTNGQVKNGFWIPKGRIVSSQLENYIGYFNKSFIQGYDGDGDALQDVRISSVSEPLWQDIGSHKKVLLIVNESWGLPKDELIHREVLSELVNNPNINNLQTSDIEFEGFTLGGELRELCHKAPIHFNLKNQSEGFEDCLPNRYKELGYRTVAVHGALSLMYDRRYWYPRAGFETILFRDQGLNLPDSRCFSFPGNCDKDIASVITTQFQNSNSLFLYWLTLNTHSIYDKRDIYTDLFDCNNFDLEDRPYSCNNLKLQKQFFHTLNDMLKNDAYKGTKVIVVSDHEPPIVSSEDSAFNPGRIPYVSFTIE
ncbi:MULTISPECIES: sulfatase-like hydrolase/transferase [unclassified Psychrobacter]|uniref:sulfatase-like hydrolase/transferase n=1 Tax=unclassified Psychrobacter TaxID=196806 RepID=UPI000AE250E1|nr:MULTISPECIES: sulfatase-like hydrolase/transferase [unclassified Psychrobacter]